MLSKGGTSCHQLVESTERYSLSEIQVQGEKVSDVRWVMDLVEACSDTLEHIDLEPQLDGKSHYSSSSSVSSRLT